MNANELRIGNWIYEPECEPHYFQIEELRKFVGSEIWAYYRKGSIKVKEPFPIPLTEEILLKCGFEKDEVVKCLHHLKIGNIIISIVIEGSDVLDVTFANTNITGVSIDTESCLYLHGLQNITHALTNTELNITL